MPSFRESHGGDFYLDTTLGRVGASPPLPILSFLARHGFTQDFRRPAQLSTTAALASAGLEWSVAESKLVADSARVPASHYKALLRPDPDRVMEVVRRSYRVAQNEWVLDASMAMARLASPHAAIVGAATFGRTDERTMFLIRVPSRHNTAVILLAMNSHGGESAVRFHAAVVDEGSNAVLTPDLPGNVVSVPHVGDIRDRLSNLRYHEGIATFAREFDDRWERLDDALWSPRHTRSLIKHFWGSTPDDAKGHTSTTGRLHLVGDRLRHPGAHLEERFRECTAAAEAFEIICHYVDHESEARERGDYTEARDERLALGAGTKLKQQAWAWITSNT
jgi:Domain of unknown function (DUF932)